jgi:hypothetical protein
MQQKFNKGTSAQVNGMTKPGLNKVSLIAQLMLNGRSAFEWNKEAQLLKPLAALP